MSRYTDEQTHHIMSSVHSKDTNIEVTLRKELWRHGYRYRKNVKNLPGKPDIVFTKYKLAIFCDSEFWHGKNWEILRSKLSMGYTVLRFWGKEILSNPSECVQAISDVLFSIKMREYDDRVETELTKDQKRTLV